MSNNNEFIFVYGTLKNRIFAERFGLKFVTDSAFVYGRLYDLDNYPMMIATGNEKVYGSVFKISSENVGRVLAKLDRYEGSQYDRKKVEVYFKEITDYDVSEVLSTAWVYVASSSMEQGVCTNNRYILSGTWG